MEIGAQVWSKMTYSIIGGRISIKLIWPLDNLSPSSYQPTIMTLVLLVLKHQELLRHPGDANRSVCLELALIYIHSEPPSRLLPYQDHTDEGEGNLQWTSISPDVQLRRLDWPDEGRLSVPSSIYPSLNKKGWSSTIHVPSYAPQIGEHANAFESLSGLTVPCGCLKSRRHSATGSGTLTHMTGDIWRACGRRSEWRRICAGSPLASRGRRKKGNRVRIRRAARWGCGQAFLQKVSLTCLFSLFCLERVISVNIQYACTFVSVSTYRMSRTKLDWDDGSEAAGCCDVQTPFSSRAVSLASFTGEWDWWVHP